MCNAPENIILICIRHESMKRFYVKLQKMPTCFTYKDFVLEKKIYLNVYLSNDALVHVHLKR